MSGSSSSLPPLVSGVVVRCPCQLVRLIYCRVILTASNPETHFHNISIVNGVERLVSARHQRFMKRSGVRPTTQIAYGKDLSTCGALLCVFHTLQSSLESGQEARVV